MDKTTTRRVKTKEVATPLEAQLSYVISRNGGTVMIRILGVGYAVLKVSTPGKFFY